MLTNKYEEIFKVIYGYLNDESIYSPMVTKNAPLRPTTFPVVEVKGTELPLSETTMREEWQNRLEITINVYAIEKTMTKQEEKDGELVDVSYKVSSLEIINELVGLIDKAMTEMNFHLTRNDEIENADKNVLRHLLSYVAGVGNINNKILRRN